jgi:periplasmic protein CpxP/Spy
MKPRLSILVGIVALSLTAIPFAVKANTTLTSQSQIVAQATDKKPNREKFAEELGLTDTQKSELQKIRQETRTAIQGVLTPEQRTQWEAAKNNRQARREGLKALNLSEEQRASIKKIKEDSKAKMDAVLTAEQKQKIEQMRQNWRSRRQSQNR